MPDKNKNNLDELQNLVEGMNYVLDISQRISENKPLDVLLAEIMDSCKTLMNAEASSLLLYNENEDKLFFHVATGDKGHEVKKISCNMGEGIAGWVAVNRMPLLIKDCHEDERFNPEFDKKTGFITKDMICVPMIHKEKLIGVLQVINKKDKNIFSETDLKLFVILASQCAVSIENAELMEEKIKQETLNREVKIAREIQQRLLPEGFPGFENLEIASELIPAKQVGGDYYNIYKISATKTLFFVSDVSGKSISASLIVSTIYSYIVTYFNLNKDKFDLNNFVQTLNKVLIESTTSEKFATCWFGLFNHETNSMQSINAGHNSIYVFRTGGVIEELNKGGIFLGCVESEFETEEIILNDGDVFVFYTDGVTEAMSIDYQQYGDDRLKNVVKDNFNLPSGEILKLILADIKDFVKDADQSDDITCCVVRITK